MSSSESPEYWRWTESRWTNPDLEWKDGDIISAGVDVGSVSTQAVVMVDGKLYCYSNMRTGSDSPDSANRAMNWHYLGYHFQFSYYHSNKDSHQPLSLPVLILP